MYKRIGHNCRVIGVARGENVDSQMRNETMNNITVYGQRTEEAENERSKEHKNFLLKCAITDLFMWHRPILG